MRQLNLKKVCVCGHFGLGRTLVNGQTIKTKIFARAIREAVGADQVLLWDTHGGLRSLLKLPGMLCRCKNIVIFPAQNGLRIIAPLLAAGNAVFRRKLHYCVIGGWLPEFLRQRKLLTLALRQFRGIWVETATMQRALEGMGFRNVRVIPNCKDMTPLAASELAYSTRPHRLCTFSRVMAEKGIEDAVNAVRAVNARAGTAVFTLDIYGPVEAGQEAWFEDLRRAFPPEVTYRGSMDAARSAEALKDCLALLFPTRFYTEGIPGTIIDAYMAGVPVIASAWESHGDLIEEGVTGLCYPFGEPRALEEILAEAAQDPGRLLDMKPACLKRAEDFTAGRLVKILAAEFAE